MTHHHRTPSPRAALRRACAATALVLACPLSWASCAGGGHAHLPQGPFVNAGDGLVRHVPSQTVWKRCAEGQQWERGGCTGQALALTAREAMERATAVNASAPGTENAGQTAWRLPRLHELRWLVEPGCTRPAINQTQFPRTPAEPFWTETPFVDGHPATDAAWTVDFAHGQAQGSDRHAHAVLRLVRVATAQEMVAPDTGRASTHPTRAPPPPAVPAAGGMPMGDPVLIVQPRLPDLPPVALVQAPRLAMCPR